MSIEFSNQNSWVRLIELTKKFQFDIYVQLLNQLNNNPSDWEWLSSTDFWFSFVRLAMPGIEYEEPQVCAWKLGVLQEGISFQKWEYKSTFFLCGTHLP